MQYHISFDISFKKNPYKGLYIALEGIDASGKTTQRAALAEYLRSKNKVVTETSEPRVDLAGGDLIMQVFRSELPMSGEAFQFFLTGNRLVNHETVVLPALEKGDIVISDRCFWSAVPYGLMDKGVDFARGEADFMLITQSLLSHYHQSIIPDIIFYIDISPEIALKRLSKRKNRKDDIYEKKEKLEKVVAGYRWLVKEYKEEFVIINGERPIDIITKDLIDKIQTHTNL